MSQRKWKFIRWGTGLLSLYLDWRLRKPKRWRTSDIFLLDSLMAHLIPKPSLEPFSNKERQKYLNAISQTVYWHGTGRWQYGPKGKVVDVLEQMLKQGGMAINLHAIKELGLWNSKTRHKQHAAWRKQGKEVWAVKVHQDPGEATGKFFDNGSDIASNYPILIGIKRADFTLLKTADYVARYESRIGSNIAIEAFTHMEVPADRRAEVRALLKKHGYRNLPVFAFEQCEQLHAKRHFSELVSQSE